MNKFCIAQPFVLLLLLAACSKESTAPDQQEKTRTEYLWLNETVLLGPGSDTTFSRHLLAQDTLHLTIGLLNQYAVSSITVRNHDDSILFSEEQVASEHFYIQIPASDSHDIVLQQAEQLSRFQLYVMIIRWEYKP